MSETTTRSSERLKEFRDAHLDYLEDGVRGCPLTMNEMNDAERSIAEEFVESSEPGAGLYIARRGVPHLPS